MLVVELLCLRRIGVWVGGLQLWKLRHSKRANVLTFAGQPGPPRQWRPRSSGAPRSDSTCQKVDAASLCEAEQPPLLSQIADPQPLLQAALRDAMGARRVQGLLFLLLLLGATSLACKNGGPGGRAGSESMHLWGRRTAEGVGAGASPGSHFLPSGAKFALSQGHIDECRRGPKEDV